MTARRAAWLGGAWLAAAALLRASFGARAGSARFYLLTATLAATWAGGALGAGPVPWRGAGRGACPASAARALLVVPVITGAGTFAVCYGAARVARRHRTLRHAIVSVLRYAEAGSTPLVVLIASGSAVAEELFFRGALWSGPRPLRTTTLAYAASTAATGNPALVLAGLVTSVIFGWQRDAAGGVLAPAVTHVTWSVLMLRYLPPLFREVSQPLPAGPHDLSHDRGRAAAGHRDAPIARFWHPECGEGDVEVVQVRERAVWRRVSPVPGQVLDSLHARIVEPYAPHLHEEFAVGACTEGVEVIRYRGALHHSGPGSVAVLAPGEPHTGGPLDRSGFVYRVMYPTADLLREASGRVPWFPQPVLIDPALADGLRRVHLALGRKADSLEVESGLAWLLGELVRRHASQSVPDADPRKASGVTRLVLARLSDRVTSPPTLAEMASEVGMSRYQLVRTFAAEVGIPPYTWLAQHRVARARTLLEEGRGLAETAAITGFADQAHLTRWFRRVVGVTPGVYRNSVQDTTSPRG